MTSDVQRYGIRHEVLKGTPDGEFVSYKDHERIVKELKDKIFVLEVQQASRYC